MNEQRFPFEKKDAGKVKGWFERRRFWLAGALLAVLVIWLILPPSYSAGGIHFTVHHAGHPGVLTFWIRDKGNRPLSGVAVKSESFSGTTKEFVTDASGTATIPPGESEVLAVYIQGHEFRFRPFSSILELTAPDCSRGLTFNVSIQNQ